MAATHADEVLSPESLDEILRAQVAGALGALLFLLLSFAAARLATSKLFVRGTLALLFGATPLLMVELGWAPYHERPSTLFQPDARLGWRLRPDAEVHWLGVPVEVNSLGVRGPERSHDAAEGVKRILFLGDSVVFGFRIEEDADTLPMQLERSLRASTSSEVEVINAGVGGWSTWQEAEFLRTEGARYRPDVVVLGFVLNDVTEKLSLQRFGGQEQGFQLRNTRRSGWVGWLAATSWADLAREAVARFDVGESASEAAAQRELLSVYDLIRIPGDPRVRRAWDLTLPQLTAIRDWCTSHAVPLMIVVFPYTVQLYEQRGQDFGAPQARLARFCRKKGVPMLDLRGPLVRAMQREGLTEYELYLDAVHPSPAGHAIVAEFIAQELLSRGWLRP